MFQKVKRQTCRTRPATSKSQTCFVRQFNITPARKELLDVELKTKCGPGRRLAQYGMRPVREVTMSARHTDTAAGGKVHPKDAARQVLRSVDELRNSRFAVKQRGEGELQSARRHRWTGIVVDHSLDAVSQVDHVEIDQQSLKAGS
jgi:hypothetical protein